jgi:putative oxygen-independent coproporphyrinogen III oxidase
LTELAPLGLPPLGLYVHWPYCARICPYCDFNVALDKRAGEAEALHAAILGDLRAQAADAGPHRLVSIFFGGGTPSLMTPDQVAAIVEAARALWPAEPSLEVTLEANPTDAEAARFEAFAAAGVNRLSLGLQALDDGALRFLGRNHSAAEALGAARLAARAFPRLSLDLIYARPGQTEVGWAEELRGALALGPEHLSPYQLTIEPGTPFDLAVRRQAFTPADPDLGARLYETTQAVLQAEGFEAYEVSNHARGEAARSRHNLIYWRGHDYIGVGPGAHGRLTMGGVRIATEAERAIPGYVQKVRETGTGLTVRETLTPVEAAEERLLMGLRTLEGVPLAELKPLPLSKLPDLEAAGFVRSDKDRLIATLQGRPVLDRVVQELAN